MNKHKPFFLIALAIVLVFTFAATDYQLSVETNSPEAAWQKPAFSGQTRIAQEKLGVQFRIETITDRLEFPWAVAFLDDGQYLVTERPGRLRLVDRRGVVSPAVAGLPRIAAGGQAGLLDVALDPGFGQNRLIYFAYTETRSAGVGLAVAQAVLKDGPQPLLSNLNVIFRAEPAVPLGPNLGSRLLFSRDKTLFITVGDRFRTRDLAQQLNNHLGKIIRVTGNGGIPSDNPFVGRPTVKSEIWSYGHRNPQGLAVNPQTGQLWAVEHGARGGDELNLVVAGKNYGWPVVAYGIDYSGQKIGRGITQKAGMEQPRYYWDPVIAPSGLAFYDGNLFPAWRGSLFVGALRGTHLARLSLKGDRVVGEERLLTDLGERIRDVRVGPDGALYILTDNSPGRLLKLVP